MLGLLQTRVSVDQSWLDYLILGIYFVFVLCIDAVLRKRMQTSEDYFLSGRSLPSWVTGLAFLGANLGAHNKGERKGLELWNPSLEPAHRDA